MWERKHAGDWTDINFQLLLEFTYRGQETHQIVMCQE